MSQKEQFTVQNKKWETCKKPRDEVLNWIACEKCEGWFHMICAGLEKVDKKIPLYAYNVGIRRIKIQSGKNVRKNMIKMIFLDLKHKSKTMEDQGEI